jgi:zinc protease
MLRSFFRPLLAGAALGFVAFTCPATPPGLVAAQPTFAHEQSDLPADPRVRFGSLPNGVRYALMANSEPQGRASLRLLVEAGSLHETEEQRGLAHYLEHLAFNGTTHYPPGALIPFFQRMGMSFGGDTNASTGFDRTLYLLELADTSEATLTEGLRIFSDYAEGMLLLPEEIDRERGVILAEKRARDTVSFRTFEAQLGFFFDGTLMPLRLPIGLTEVIETSHRDLFLDYYDTWYRPERTSIIAVGDFELDALEQQIREAFVGLTARAPARPEPDRGTPPAAEGVRAHYHHEPESPNTSVVITTLLPYTPPTDTAANRLAFLPRNLAHAMITRRFAELAKAENAPFISAAATASEPYDIALRTTVSLTTRADQWAEALAAGEQELRRALEHGFAPEELAEVKAATLNSLDQAVRSAPTRRSSSLAEGIAASILNRRVFTSPETQRDLFRPALEAVTVDDCLAALREAWQPAHRHVFVGGNASLTGDAVATIVRSYQESQAVAVTAPPAAAAAAWAYADFGAPGKVVSRETVPDLEIVLVEFANGVRLNLKRTDFESNVIRVSARVGHGRLTEPADQPGLASLAGGTFIAGGLGQHSTDDLRRLFAGRNVGIGFSVDTDALVLGGSTTPDDLNLQLELLAARLTDPGYRPEALRLAHRSLEQMYLGFNHTANGPLAMEVAPLLASGDHRFGTPPRDVMFARTLDEVRAWLTPQLTAGPLEVAIVGDLDVEATIAAVARTLGALPARSRDAAPDGLRQVRFPAEPFARDFTIDSQLPKGLGVFYWPTTDGMNVHTARRLGLLSRVMTERLRLSLREELGLVYSASVRSNSSDTFPGYGYFNSSIDLDPGTVPQIIAAIEDLTSGLHTEGVTDDELERSKLPALTSIRDSGRTNGYWLGNVLARAQSQPEVLDWARTRESDTAAITVAELNELVQRYLHPDRISRAVILPR